MQKLFAVNLLIIMMTLCVRSGESLKCFVCRSDVHAKCGEPSDTTSIQDCPVEAGKKAYCRKIYQKVRFKDDKSFTSIRTCGSSKGKYDCYNFKWVELAYQTTCECDTDLCNRGLALAPPGLYLALAASASALARLDLR